MTRSNEKENEALWQKILLLLLDKGFLAGVIVFLGYFVTVNADHLKTVWSTLWSYQEKLFDKRWDAYSKLLEHADRVLAESAVYFSAPDDPADPLAFDPWPRKIDNLEGRWRDIRRGTSSGSGGGNYNSVGDVASALRELVNARANYALLIPSWLDKSLNDFIRTVQSEVDAELTRLEKFMAAQDKEQANKLRLTPAETRKVWSRIRAAHFAFKENLRSTFGLDLRPSGG